MRLILIADLHGNRPDIPPGDILIVAGDWAVGDTVFLLRRDIGWLESLPHREKIVIGGDHDLILARNLHRIPSSITCLSNQTITIAGIKFHGLSWLGQPRIPDKTEVVISHRPPFVMVQPELEKTRSPLVSIPPFRAGIFKALGLSIR